MSWIDKTIESWKKRRNQRNAKKYIHKVRKDLVKKTRSATSFSGGRKTTPLWKRGFYVSQDMPLRRQPHRNKNILDTLKIIRDTNPDASMAVWNYLRLSNQGHEVEVTGVDGEPDEVMQEYINEELAPRIGKLYKGGTDQLVNVLNLTCYTEGAEALEVELNESLDDVVDFHAISPSKLDFICEEETEELVLAEKQTDGKYKKLNENQVFYIPLDPDVDDPYGRSPMLPAIEAVFFQAEVLRDLKAVAHHQGHARFDVSVASEAILENIPENIQQQGEEAVKKFVDNYLDSIEDNFAKLDPDDDFYHDSSIEVKMVGGTAGKSMDSKSLIDIINQQMVSSLKQLPILLGRNESTTETHGSIQWEIHVAGIQSMQTITKRLLEKAYTVALRIKGSQSSVRVTFNSVRTKDRTSEASAEAQEMQNEVFKVQQGWITNDDAANTIVGHEAVAEPQSIQDMQQLLSQLNQQDSDGDDEKDEETKRLIVERFNRKFPSSALKRGDPIDEFALNEGLEFSAETARLIPKAQEAVKKVLNTWLESIQERLKKAPPFEIERKMQQSNRFVYEEKYYDYLEWFFGEIVEDYPDDEVTMMEDAIYEWIEETVVKIGQINSQSIKASLKFNEKDQRLLNWLDWRAENSAIEMVGTTYSKVMDTIWKQVSSGPYTMDKIANSLKSNHAFSEARAQLTARNEVLSAQAVGQYESDKQSGMVIGKEWHSAVWSDKTRDAHKSADGQIREFSDFFDVNGEKLLYPKDGTHGASLENLIQCRCFYTRILEGQEDKLQGIIKDGAEEYFEGSNGNISDFFKSSKNYQDWKNGLSEASIEALDCYSGGNYKAMNEIMRQGEDSFLNNPMNKGTPMEWQQKMIANAKEMKNALDGYTVEKNFITYRATPGVLNIEKSDIGVIDSIDDGFMSTSLDKKVCDDFAGGDSNVFFEIKVNKGQKVGAYIEEFSQYAKEREFLFKPGTKFKVLDIVKEQTEFGSNQYLTLEVIE